MVVGGGRTERRDTPPRLSPLTGRWQAAARPRHCRAAPRRSARLRGRPWRAGGGKKAGSGRGTPRGDPSQPAADRLRGGMPAAEARRPAACHGAAGAEEAPGRAEVEESRCGRWRGWGAARPRRARRRPRCPGRGGPALPGKFKGAAAPPPPAANPRRPAWVGGTAAAGAGGWPCRWGGDPGAAFPQGASVARPRRWPPRPGVKGETSEEVDLTFAPGPVCVRNPLSPVRPGCVSARAPAHGWAAVVQVGTLGVCHLPSCEVTWRDGWDPRPVLAPLGQPQGHRSASWGQRPLGRVRFKGAPCAGLELCGRAGKSGATGRAGPV